MNKILLCSALLLALASCTTSASFVLERAPDQTLLNPNVKFTVLGLVSVVSGKKLKGVRGIRDELLQEAKKQYPAADWVVDITVTRQKSAIIGLLGSDESEYTIFEGLAIDFAE